MPLASPVLFRGVRDEIAASATVADGVSTGGASGTRRKSRTAVRRTVDLLVLWFLFFAQFLHDVSKQ